MTRRERRKKKFFLPVLGFVGLAVYLWATSRIFAANPKLTVVVNSKDKVIISTFDREGGSIYNLLIPANTQVNVSRELGTWRAESIWELGENEGLGGVLLTETILKNFKVPTFTWADENYLKFSYSKTNLGVGDRLRLALFSLGVSPAKRINIDLADLAFLKKTKLVGGEEGYVLSANLPQSLYFLFSDPLINGSNLRIEIQNNTQRGSGADLVASTLEVLGGKASAITKATPEDFFCEVAGEEKEVVRKIARIFGCKIGGKKEADNFDITIKIGEEFAKRY